MAKNTPRVQICTPGANLHPGAICAHERGLSELKGTCNTWSAISIKRRSSSGLSCNNALAIH